MLQRQHRQKKNQFINRNVFVCAHRDVRSSWVKTRRCYDNDDDKSVATATKTENIKHQANVPIFLQLRKRLAETQSFSLNWICTNCTLHNQNKIELIRLAQPRQYFAFIEENCSVCACFFSFQVREQCSFIHWNVHSWPFICAMIWWEHMNIWTVKHLHMHMLTRIQNTLIERPFVLASICHSHSHSYSYSHMRSFRFCSNFSYFKNCDAVFDDDLDPTKMQFFSAAFSLCAIYHSHS